jgi:hypothetical protein
MLAFEKRGAVGHTAAGLRRFAAIHLRFISVIVFITPVLLPFTRPTGSVKEIESVPKRGIVR